MVEYCSGSGEMGECEGEQGKEKKSPYATREMNLMLSGGVAGGVGSPFLASDNQN